MHPHSHSDPIPCMQERTCYAMPRTDIVYAAICCMVPLAMSGTAIVSSTEIAYGGVMFGTGIPYGGRCP
eukprot:1715231-Rhodomonas_salina.2